ncbi:AraC family transcriptional regulator [Sphingobacterium sp. SYP-B4668]|uniref:AraC family transcriptional regulator n=1 Tax=Sphingobacterium sp. SYP-B4668 TaxID=2996035 RepID=UPI0022DD923B|nr:helix-turn-helix transcriptional regulator [Sphingobacterium sp. SYP-B4668]
MAIHIPVLDQCVLSHNHEGVLLVEDLASYLDRNSHLEFPHRHNFYQMLLFTKGAGTHSIDFEKFKITPWQIYFMLPGQIHRWDFEGEMQGYIVNFQPDFFKTFLLRPDLLNQFPFLSGMAKEQVFQIREQQQADVLSIMGRLISNRDLDFSRVGLLYLFKILDQQLDHVESGSVTDYNYMLLRNFQNLIEHNYQTMRLPKEYATLLYITPNHLNALSKQYLGASAGEIIRNRVLLEAKRLLVIKDYSISTIAYELNFNDNSYFTKFFKKIEGITPEEFRRRYAYNGAER